MTPSGIYMGDCLEVMRGWPERSVHCCITSPPYWCLRVYGWGGDGSCRTSKGAIHDWPDPPPPTRIMDCKQCGAHAPTFGWEPTIDEFIASCVEVFREVRRVLRDDGTLWLNMGDSYSSGGRGETTKKPHDGQRRQPLSGNSLDLTGQPWRLAFALQQDGWILRSAIVWAKGASFNEHWNGSVMPESVSGWRWERCRVKERSARHTTGQADMDDPMMRESVSVAIHDGEKAQWSPCPGCKKCEPHDGYLLRKGSGRATSAYEMLFMFAKTRDYFYDSEAVKEAQVSEEPFGELSRAKDVDGSGDGRGDRFDSYRDKTSGRNIRNVFAIGDDEWNEFQAWRQASRDRDATDVWAIGTKGYKEAHFAVFPESLVKPCIEAGTSERGCCPECGSPYARVKVDKCGVPWYSDTNEDVQSMQGSQAIGRISPEDQEDVQPLCREIETSATTREYRRGTGEGETIPRSQSRKGFCKETGLFHDRTGEADDAHRLSEIRQDSTRCKTTAGAGGSASKNAKGQTERAHTLQSPSGKTIGRPGDIHGGQLDGHTKEAEEPLPVLQEKVLENSSADNRPCNAAITGGQARPREHCSGVSPMQFSQTREAGMAPVAWRPTCECNAGDPAPCTVLDPFAGSGTTLAVAAKLGRRWAGIELSPDYEDLIRDRLGLFMVV